MLKRKIKPRKEINMLEGPVLKNIIRFVIPLAIMSILQNLYNAADIIVVGNFAGANALASVGATSSSINLIVNLFIGLSLGASVTVSQFLGEGNLKKVSKAVHTSVLISIIGGTLLMIIGFFIARPLLTVLKTPPEVLDGAVLYMKIYFIGMPGSMIFNYGSGILRADGNTKTPLKISMIAGVLNVLLNLLFVIVLKMSVDGVAYATIISQYLSAFLTLRVLCHSGGATRLSLRALRIDKEALFKILKIGVPSGINSSLFSISNVLIQSTVNSFGAAAVAGNSAAGSIEAFQYAALNSFYQAALTFTAQNYGAKKYERFKRIIGACFLSATVVATFFVLLLVPFGREFIMIYNKAPEVVEFGYIKVLILSVTYVLCTYQEVITGAVRAIGKSFSAMINSVFGICIFRVLWIYLVFPLFKTPESLFISYPISWILVLVMNSILFYLSIKKLKKQKESAE